MTRQIKNSLMNIPLHKLYRGRYQTRIHFDDSLLVDLASSIREQGVIQPLIVRADGKGDYEIVAGERRWRAAQLAGLSEVPCLVKPYSNEQMAAVTTIENLQRCDLNPIEEAQAFQRMISEFNYIHDELACLLGKSRVYITNSLRLLKLIPEVQQLVIEQKLQSGHAKVLAGVPHSQQYKLSCDCVEGQWSVRKLEKAIKQNQEPKQTHQGIKHKLPVDIAHLEQALALQMGAEVKVDVNMQDQGGWFKVKFYNPDTLAGLLEKMGLQYES